MAGEVWQIYDVEGEQKRNPLRWKEKIAYDIQSNPQWSNVKLGSGMTGPEMLARGADPLEVLGQMEDHAFVGRGMPKPDRTFQRRMGTMMHEGVVAPVQRLGEAITTDKDVYGVNQRGGAAAAGQMLADEANTVLNVASLGSWPAARSGAMALLGGSAAGAAMMPALQRGAQSLEAGADYSDPNMAMNVVKNLPRTVGASLLEAGGPMLIPGLRALGRGRATPEMLSKMGAMDRLMQTPLSAQGAMEAARGMVPQGRPQPTGEQVPFDYAAQLRDQMAAERAGHAQGFDQAPPMGLDDPAFQRQGVDLNAPRPSRALMALPQPGGQAPAPPSAMRQLRLPQSAAPAPGIPGPGFVMGQTDMPPPSPAGFLPQFATPPQMGPEGPGQFSLTGPLYPRELTRGGDDIAMRAQFQPGMIPDSAPPIPQAPRMQPQAPRQAPKAPPAPAPAAVPPRAAELPIPGQAPAPVQKAAPAKTFPKPTAEQHSPIPDVRGRWVLANGKLGHVIEQRLNKVKVQMADGQVVNHDLRNGFNPSIKAYGEQVKPLPFTEKAETYSTPERPGPLQGASSVRDLATDLGLQRGAGEPPVPGIELPNADAQASPRARMEAARKMAMETGQEVKVPVRATDLLSQGQSKQPPAPTAKAPLAEKVKAWPTEQVQAELDKLRGMRRIDSGPIEDVLMRELESRAPKGEAAAQAAPDAPQAPAAKPLEQRSLLADAEGPLASITIRAWDTDPAARKAYDKATPEQKAAFMDRLKLQLSSSARRVRKYGSQPVEEFTPPTPKAPPTQTEMPGTGGDFALVGQQAAKAAERYAAKQPQSAARQMEAAQKAALAEKPAEPVEASLFEAAKAEPGPMPQPVKAGADGEAVVTKGDAPRPKASYKADPQGYLDQLTSQMVDTSKIKVHPSMQYKRGGNPETGVVDPLKGDYSPFLAGDGVVWQDLKGDLYVANGHHRLDLAKKSRTGKFQSKLVKESDGVTFEDAKNIGAEMNFVEGKGTIYDNTKMMKDRADKGRPIPIDHPGVRGPGEDAWLIANRSIPDLFAAFMASEGGAPGGIKAKNAAAAIRAAGTGPQAAALQRVGMKAALKPGATPEMVRDNVNAARMLGEEATQGGLFGEETFIDMENLAKTKRQITEKVRDQVLASQGAIKRPGGAEKMGVNINDPVRAKARLDRLKGILSNLDDSSWASNSEIVALVNDVNRKNGNPVWDFINGKDPDAPAAPVLGDIGGAMAAGLSNFAKQQTAKARLHWAAKANLDSMADAARGAMRDSIDAVNEWRNLPLEQGSMGGTVKRIFKTMTAAPSYVSPLLSDMISKAQDRRLETDQVFLDRFKGIIDGLNREQLDNQLLPAFMDGQGFNRIQDQVVKDKAKQLAALVRDIDGYGGENVGKLFPTFFGWTAQKGGKRGVYMPEDGIFIDAEGRTPSIEELFLARLKTNTKKAFIMPALKDARRMAEGVKDAGNKAYIDYWLDRVQGKADPITSMIEQNFGITDREQHALVRKLNVWTYRSLLGLALDTSFKNLGQNVNTAATFGALPTAKAMLQLLTPQGRQIFRDSGVMVDALSVFEQPNRAFSQRRIWSKLDPILFAPMKASEFFNRGVAFHAALFEAANRGLKGEAARDFAKWATNKTQFRYDVADTNPYFNNPVGKLFYQFHSYPTKQAYFLYNMAKQGGDKSALIRHLMLTGMIVGLGNATDSDFNDMMSTGTVGGVPVPYSKLLPGMGGLPFEGGAALGGIRKLAIEAPTQMLEGQGGAASRTFKQGLAPFAARYPLKLANEFNREEGPRASNLLGVMKR